MAISYGVHKDDVVDILLPVNMPCSEKESTENPRGKRECACSNNVKTSQMSRLRYAMGFKVCLLFYRRTMSLYVDQPAIKAKTASTAMMPLNQ